MSDALGGEERPLTERADPLLRPEVMACQRRAEDLRSEADEVFDAAAFWASLITDCCDGVKPCDHPLCYEAWRQYPDG